MSLSPLQNPTFEGVQRYLKGKLSSEGNAGNVKGRHETDDLGLAICTCAAASAKKLYLAKNFALFAICSSACNVGTVASGTVTRHVQESKCLRRNIKQL